MNHHTQQPNIDPTEIDKFSQLAHKWWDKNSEFKPLHDINPLRLHYIDSLAKLPHKTVLDVGCGGGILSESMARMQAQVTGIDMAKKSLKIAQLHALEHQINTVQYRLISVEELAEEQPQSFDIVTCMEMMEHVPNPSSIVQACAKLVKPNGWVFFSTINRNRRSYLQAILAAEYILKLLPKGTHDYQKFITPAELARMCRASNLSIIDTKGMTYNPLSKNYRLTEQLHVNYMIACRMLTY